eukprot:5778415-Heterocapsa_arctica.AAC.1
MLALEKKATRKRISIEGASKEILGLHAAAVSAQAAAAAAEKAIEETKTELQAIEVEIHSMQLR